MDINLFLRNRATELYEGDFDLPLYPDDTMIKLTISEFDKIAKLNHLNSLKFIIENITTEDVYVVFSLLNKTKKIHFVLKKNIMN